MAGGWNIRPGTRERNLLIAVASTVGAAVGAVVVWVWDTASKQMRYPAPPVRPKGARGS